MANYANIWCKIKASENSLEKIYEAMKLEKGTHEKWMREAFLKLDSTLEVSSKTTYGENTWITSCKKSNDNIQMTLVCNEGFAESEFDHLHKTFGAEISYLLHYNDSFIKFDKEGGDFNIKVVSVEWKAGEMLEHHTFKTLDEAIEYHKNEIGSVNATDIKNTHELQSAVENYRRNMARGENTMFGCYTVENDVVVCDFQKATA